MPITFVGDMPRVLFSNGDWRALKIDLKDVRCGDIFFVRHKKSERLLTHAAIFLGIDKIFHCSLSSGTAEIQTEDEFFESYEQPCNFKKMVRYIDRRNAELRLTHGGAFILD